MRLELIYNHAFDAKFKYTEAPNYSSSVKLKTNSVMLRGLVDVADMGVAKIYLGAGLGWAQVGANFSDTGYKTFPKYSAKAKNKNNLAYSVHAGSGFAVADGVMLDVAYSFRDLGSTKAFATQTAAQGGLSGGKAKARSHNVSAGVRFDI